MVIFLSWSKIKSKKVAEILKSWLEFVFPNHLEVWTSFDDIKKGSISLEEIEKALISCHCGVFCLTEENYKEPWIMFEAGALFKRFDLEQERILLWTIAFDFEITNVKETPLHYFQVTKFNKEDMYKLFQNVHNKMIALDKPSHKNENSLLEHFEMCWNRYSTRIKETIDDYANRGTSMNKEQFIEELDSNGFIEHHDGNITFYEKGFEDYPLYEILLKNAQKRLWIFGRKNKKLFDQRNNKYWKGLKEKKLTGLDVRCLFLDPDSAEEILHRAQDKTEFQINLKLCIIDAYDKIKLGGVEPADICRTYSFERKEAIMIIDDVVLFSQIHYTDFGKPSHLTDAAFNVVSIVDEIGKYYFSYFKKSWSKAKPLTSPPSFSESCSNII